MHVNAPAMTAIVRYACHRAMTTRRGSIAAETRIRGIYSADRGGLWCFGQEFLEGVERLLREALEWVVLGEDRQGLIVRAHIEQPQ